MSKARQLADFISTSTVSAAEIADGAVTSSKISDGAVSSSKIASGAVSSSLGYTPVNKAGDTMTGSIVAHKFLPALSATLSRSGAGTVSTGWYRIARSSDGGTGSYGTRGGCTVFINSQGGWLGPGVTKIEVFKDYSTFGTLTADSKGSSYFYDYRITMDSNYAYLEGYTEGFSYGGDFELHTSILPYAGNYDSGGWTLYNETLTLSSATPQSIQRANFVRRNHIMLERLHSDSDLIPTERIHAGAWNINSAFSNPTQDLLKITDPGPIYAQCFAEVLVTQNPWSNGGGGNMHVGYANYYNSGNSKNVTTMTLRGQPSGSVGNVGTLSWSGDRLQYTANRASNYDSYQISIIVAAKTVGVQVMI